MIQKTFQALISIAILSVVHLSACGKALQFTADGFSATADTATIWGGAPATAAWAQSWSGGIAELILLAETPTDEQLNALRCYLALKHGLAVPSESDGGIVSALTVMGIDTDGLFSSVFILR